MIVLSKVPESNDAPIFVCDGFVCLRENLFNKLTALVYILSANVFFAGTQTTLKPTARRASAILYVVPLIALRSNGSDHWISPKLIILFVLFISNYGYNFFVSTINIIVLITNFQYIIL